MLHAFVEVLENLAYRLKADQVTCTMRTLVVYERVFGKLVFESRKAPNDNAEV